MYAIGVFFSVNIFYERKDKKLQKEKSNHHAIYS